MKSLEKFVSLMAIAVSLSGCGLVVPEHWERSNSTLEDLKYDDQACILESTKDFPISYQQVLVQGAYTTAGYTTPVQTNCQSSGGDITLNTNRIGNTLYTNGSVDSVNTTCSTTGGQYIPPMFHPAVYDTQDINASSRENDRKVCMSKHGWKRDINFLGVPYGNHRNGVAITDGVENNIQLINYTSTSTSTPKDFNSVMDEMLKNSK